MDQFKGTGDFPLREQPWAPNLPHHPPQPDSASALAPASAPAMNLDQQLPLPPIPQDGLSRIVTVQTPATSSHVLTSPPSGGPPSAFVSQSPVGGDLTPSQQHKEYMKAKRRVPASQRKRTQVSCDACKTRRCKCIRLPTGAGSEDDSGLPPCKLCTNARIPCVTTMPRKQRVYGSVENLDRRYRSLEALVSGLFPALAKASAEDLVAFGRSKGITMPDFNDAPEQTRHASAGPSGTTITSPSSTSSDRMPYAGLGVVNLERSYPILPPAYATKTAPMVPQLLPRPPHEGAIDPEDGYLGLIQDSSGRPHYIGPSGSLAFFVNVRKLVSRHLAPQNDPQAVEWRGQGHYRGTAEILTEKLAQSLGGNVEQSGPDNINSSKQTRILSSSDEPSISGIEGDGALSADPKYRHHHKPASMIDLPTREEADACVEAYFQHFHPNFILFHRSTFQRTYEALWISWEAVRKGIGDEETKEVTVASGWLCLLLSLHANNTNDLMGAWLFQGRPSAIDCREMDVGIPEDDFLEGNILPPRYLEHAAPLYVIIAAIRRDIFDPAYVPSRMYRRALDYLEPLASWQSSLPRRMRPASAEDGLDGDEKVWRRVHLLHVRYHHTLCLLARPFLLKTIESVHGGNPLGPDAAIIVGLGRVCLTGAMRAADLLLEMWHANCLNGVTWSDVFYVHIASLTIILAWLSPQALEQDRDQDPSQLPFPYKQHIQSYTSDEMRGTVRQLCHMMTSVDMCGTHARCAKVSLELAKAVGIIEPENPAFRSSPLPNARPMGDKQGTGTEDRCLTRGDVKGGSLESKQGYTQQHQQEQQHQQQPQFFPETGAPGYPAWPGDGASAPDMHSQNPGLDMDFSGVLSADPGLVPDEMQWDMVATAAQWNDNGLNMDMIWDPHYPNLYPPGY
ncbi:hypothetical protein DL764_006556 [Monosporascus ibericus]|uniref:Zn(2)-C6 fungal-type domain-containing protein n=1 Tax=Monosporascus ibericus TaxID=155417 RepID=A0A4Q4T6U0_9PEZI|nr:hypothetical protein DL764_006556 [Monosporascus ibericus]